LTAAVTHAGKLREILLLLSEGGDLALWRRQLTCAFGERRNYSNRACHWRTARGIG